MTIISFVVLCINDCHDFVFCLVDIFVYYVMQPNEPVDDENWWHEADNAQHPNYSHVLNVAMLLMFVVILVAPCYLPVRLVILELLTAACMYKDFTTHHW